MSSVQRYYAQKQNTTSTNKVKLIAPVLNLIPDNNPFVLYLDLTSFQLYNVDMRNVKGNTGPRFHLTYDPTIAEKYPGLEFTIFFDSYNDPSVYESGEVLVKIQTQDMPGSEVQVTSFNGLSANNPVQNITFRSNGRIFNIAGSGPTYTD